SPGAPASRAPGPEEAGTSEVGLVGPAPEPPRLAGGGSEAPDEGLGPVLWHQVQPHEDWATLVARYNIADPRELIAANGLSEPRSLVPGDWVRVPCHLARPVWELRPEQEEATHA
ncbi:MAG TPA: LysM domain-containing protein, partial [Limnochorda sp.]